MVLSIGYGASVEQCRAWATGYNLTYPVLADSQTTIGSIFGIPGVPSNFILDCNRVVLYRETGFSHDLVMEMILAHLPDISYFIHSPIGDREDTTRPISIIGTLESGQPFSEGYPILRWNRDGSSTFQSLPMEPDSQNRIHPDRSQDYRAEIPAPMTDGDVFYYIDSANDSGCLRTYPFYAPAELYSFHAGRDTSPPVIDHVPIGDVTMEMLPLIVQADVWDNLGISSVILEYVINSGEIRSIPMTGEGVYSAPITDELEAGDLISYRIIATDIAQIPNLSYHPSEGYHRITILERVPALIVDLTTTQQSGFVLYQEIISLLTDADYITALPETLLNYDAVFVCLGVAGAGNHVLTDTEGNTLAHYLDAGGRMYMEGGNTWWEDPQTPVHPYFHVIPVAGGIESPEIKTVLGIDGTFTDGLCFDYSGNDECNRFLDTIHAKNDAVSILESQDPSVGIGVAYRSNIYKTVAVSLLYDGLEQKPDGPHPDDVLQQILHFFDLDVDLPAPASCPSPTPDTCRETGVTLHMPDHQFAPGDTCFCSVTVCNASGSELNGHPLFVLLDIHGYYYFGPGFTAGISNYLHIVSRFPSGETVIPILPSFTWPDHAGEADGVRWLSALTNPEMTEIIGNWDSWEFGWNSSGK